jgi:ribosomal protein S18 acetylase RimI-like enzyme
MVIEIRKGKEEDLEKIWILEIESRIDHKKITDKKYLKLCKNNINKKAKLEFIKEFKKDLKKRNFLFLVTEINKEVIGYICAYISEWWWSDNPPKTIRINDLAVLKKYRRNGVATKLIKELERLAKSKKANFLSLNLWLKNKPAYNLYKKNKYEDFGIEMVKRLK